MIEDTITMERWRAYEDEWRSSPHIDDLAAHWSGWHKARAPVEIPMTVEDYRRKFRGEK